MRMQWIPLIVALIVNLAADFYIYRRLAREYTQRWPRVAHVVLSALLLVYLIVALALPHRSMGNGGLLAKMWMLYTYFAFYIPRYFSLLIYWLCRIVPQWRRRPGPSIAAGALGAFIFISMWWATLITRYSYDVEEMTLAYDNLPESFEGYRMVQISDLHLGSYGTDTAYVSRLVDAINDLEPDVIFFTGDIVNRQSAEAEPFVKPLGRLTARDGVFSVLGNHDYGDYMNWTSDQAKADNMQLLLDLQAQMGWKMLNNSHAIITRQGQEIAIIGVENWGEPPFSQYGRLSEAYPELNDSRFKILLSHNPRHWRAEVLPQSNIDLMLAGHTHAMQLEIDLLGLRLSPSAWVYPEWAGAYREQNQVLYVNIGIGEVAMPARIGATPEITLITLKRS